MRKTFGLFRRDARGLAALEFALILPILLTMVFGMVELELALGARTNVAQMASTVADLIAQEKTVTTADLSNVYNAANTILYPYYTTTNGQTAPAIRITSVIYDPVTKSTSSGKVDWSCVSGTGLSPLSKGTTVPFNGSSYQTDANGNEYLGSKNQDIMTPDGSVLVATVRFSYSTPTTRVVTGPIALTNTFYLRPRRAAQIPTPTGGCP